MEIVCLHIPGTLLAIAAAHQVAAPGVMCLRGVNPYVSAALTDWGRRGGGAEPLVPRAAAPATDAPMWDAVTGDFGFLVFHSAILTPTASQISPAVTRSMISCAMWCAVTPGSC